MNTELIDKIKNALPTELFEYILDFVDWSDAFTTIRTNNYEEFLKIWELLFYEYDPAALYKSITENGGRHTIYHKNTCITIDYINENANIEELTKQEKEIIKHKKHKMENKIHKELNIIKTKQYTKKYNSNNSQGSTKHKHMYR